MRPSLRRRRDSRVPLRSRSLTSSLTRSPAIPAAAAPAPQRTLGSRLAHPQMASRFMCGSPCFALPQLDLPLPESGALVRQLVGAGRALARSSVGLGEECAGSREANLEVGLAAGASRLERLVKRAPEPLDLLLGAAPELVA